MYRYLRSLKRELSLAVGTVDVFTGSFAKGISVTLIDRTDLPIVKPDGWHVFYNLTDAEYTVSLRGRGYLPETVTVAVGAPPVTVKMIPAAGYPVSSGDTWIEGCIAPDTLMFVTPKDTGGFKLMRVDNDIITVLSSSPYSLSGGYISAGNTREYYWVEERLDDFSYRLSRPLAGTYGKSERIYPVSIGRSDKGGYIFCPVRRFLKEHREVWLEIGGKVISQTINFGAANSIVLNGV